MAQKWPKMAQKFAPAEKIAQIYLPHLPLFASLLCPSGDCTGDCEMPFEQEETNQTETLRRPYATQPSWKFKWCSARCNVWKHKGCCYNPVCRERRSRACRWLNYLTGWLISSAAVSWQQFFRENLPTPWQLAPWYLEMWDAGDSNPRHLLLGRRRTVLPRSVVFFCQTSRIQFHENKWFKKNQFSALQCWLECEPGYVAQRVPLITCVDGEYEKGCHYFGQCCQIFSNMVFFQYHGIGFLPNLSIESIYMKQA